MNTHDKIKLPPHDATASHGGMKPVRLYSEAKVRAAIEADRKRGGEPVGLTAMQRQMLRNVAHEQNQRAREKGDYHDHVADLLTSIALDPQPAEPDVLPGEAIFGFAAWLTSLKTPVTFSECHGAAIGADLAAAYNTSQGFIQVREDFHKRLKPYPKYEPSQPTKPAVKDSLTVADLKMAGDDLSLIEQLREYAADNGYSHIDYADTMAAAADALERAQPASDDSARLDWIEKNARRDPKMDGNHVYWPTAFNKTIRGPSLREAIDAVMQQEPKP